MIIVPFGFFAKSASFSAPQNIVLPSIEVTDEGAKLIEYTAGEWEGADDVTFAWYQGGILQEDATENEFTASYGVEVKVIETATNEAGSAQAESNTIVIPPPPYYDTGSIEWGLQGFAIEAVDPEEDLSDSGSIEWGVSGIMQEGRNEDFSEAASVVWEVFGTLTDT
jgi:hypothetical protein